MSEFALTNEQEEYIDSLLDSIDGENERKKIMEILSWAVDEDSPLLQEGVIKKLCADHRTNFNSVTRFREEIKNIQSKKKNAHITSERDKLIKLGMAQTEEFLVDDRGMTNAVIKTRSHIEVHIVDSDSYKQYLSKKYYDPSLTVRDKRCS